MLDLLAAFESCAERFRDGGAFLAVLDREGRLLHHDENAPAGARTEALALIRSAPGDISDVPAQQGELRTLSYTLPDLPVRIAVVVRAEAYTPAQLRSLAGLVRQMMDDRRQVRNAAARADALTCHLADAYEELSLLYQVSTGMRVNRTPDEFFRPLCSDIRAVVDARVVGVAIRSGNQRENTLVVQGELELDPSRLAMFADQTTELLIDHRQPVILNDVRADATFGFLAPEVRQLILVPLLRGETMLGFIFAVDKVQTRAFLPADAKLLSSVATAAAVYCENSFLYADMHGLMMGLLHSLVAAVDAKDAYTSGHSQRVAQYSRQLAHAIGLSDAECDRVYISGLLHDVGKIGVPEEILRKPGKLSDAEFEAMKRHPEIGARILSDVRQVQDILPGVLHHHERYDGKGYPGGLAGRDIPLLGRIICLADSFDAMTSDRTYRPGMPVERALAELARCAGAQFDPELTATFVKLNLISNLTVSPSAARSRLRLAWAA